jgi:hypothetical protein
MEQTHLSTAAANSLGTIAFAANRHHAGERTPWRPILRPAGENIGYDDVVTLSEDAIAEERDWTAYVKGLLKAELKRRNVSYRDLVARCRQRVPSGWLRHIIGTDTRTA